MKFDEIFLLELSVDWFHVELIFTSELPDLTTFSKTSDPYHFAVGKNRPSILCPSK